MLKPARLFQNHMVLQREKIIKVWGTGKENETVSVLIQGRESVCCTDRDGKWSVDIGPLHTSYSETMTITSGQERIVLQDVQVGEVWLAGGQSNMEFHMRYDADFASEAASCENNNIRLFDYPEVYYTEQINEADYGENFAFWRKATPQDLEWFSAVAYYFAKEINNRYGIPIGIVGCNWGGTPACAWMSEEAIKDGGGQIYIDEYRNAVAHLDLPAYEENFRNNPASWKLNPFADPFSDMLLKGMSLVDVIRILTGQEIDLSTVDFSAQVPVMGPKNERRPGGLYESMLCQVAPFGIRGILFYQGSSDGDRYPELYKTLFPALIRCFRSLWQEELPFLFVQLQPLERWMHCVGEPYVKIREAQQLTANTVPNTGMAVISDVGMEFDIHPKKKQPVGYRLALLAAGKVYGEDILCEAPTLTNVEAEDGCLHLYFENTGDGLSLSDQTPDGVEVDPGKLGGLRLLVDGYDLDLSNITAEAQGNVVELKGPAFHKDARVIVELGCTGWYRINLYNSAGIPARPCRLSNT